MNVLNELQDWFQKQCDGDWEHGDGVQVRNLDNPGWMVQIHLEGTALEGVPFPAIEDLEPETDWIKCWIEDNIFNGVGGPHKLEQILQSFLLWAQTNAD